MLPSELLQNYAENFYGFGHWEAKIWFIGIEEAGGYSEQDVQRRLSTWKQNGSRALEDAPTFYVLSLGPAERLVGGQTSFRRK